MYRSFSGVAQISANAFVAGQSVQLISWFVCIGPVGVWIKKRKKKTVIQEITMTVFDITMMIFKETIYNSCS